MAERYAISTLRQRGRGASSKDSAATREYQIPAKLVLALICMVPWYLRYFVLTQDAGGRQAFLPRKRCNVTMDEWRFHQGPLIYWHLFSLIQQTRFNFNTPDLGLENHMATTGVSESEF